jgi:anti-anti-sigma regulatory factor
MIKPADMITVLPVGSPREARDADQDWGGFILCERSNRLVHIKLTGRLSKATLNRTHRAVLGLSPTDGPRFILLDGEALEHIPLDVAKAFAKMESSLARRDVVLLWCSLTPYLANILVVSGIDGDALPCFSDSGGALRATRAVQSDTPGTARIRLAAWGCLRH